MTGPLRVLIDGAPGGAVPVTDRGFQYGDGLFETMRVAGGRLPLWSYHLARLVDSAARLDIPLNVEQLTGDCERLVGDARDGVVRLTLTRGDSARGYAIPGDARSRLIVALYPPSPARVEHYTEGVRVRQCETRLAEQPRLAGLKHLNRLEQVLARREWSAPEFDEGLMLDTGGRLVEGTFTNLFLVLDGQICTPKLDRCGVAGVMRAWLLDERPGFGDMSVSERDLWPEDLERAQACFMTNSLVGVWPVRSIVMSAGTRAFSDATMAVRISDETRQRLGFDATD